MCHTGYSLSIGDLRAHPNKDLLQQGLIEPSIHVHEFMWAIPNQTTTPSLNFQILCVSIVTLKLLPLMVLEISRGAVGFLPELNGPELEVDTL